MGFAAPETIDTSVRPSSLYKGCFYCGRCAAHYTPNLVWGVDLAPRGSTTTGPWVGLHRKGVECPICGQVPSERVA